MNDVIPAAAGMVAPGRWRRVRTLAWLLVLSLAVVLPLPIQGIAKAVLRPSEALVALLGWLLAATSFLIYAGMVRAGERRAAIEIAPRALPRDLSAGLLIGLGMFLLVMAALRGLGIYELVPGAWTDWWSDARNALLTGFLEELIFRLVIFRLLLHAFGRWPALVAAALIFGGLHLLNPHASWIGAAAIAVEAGLVLSAFYLLTARIWMSVGVHAGWNFAEFAIFGATMSGQIAAGSLFRSWPAPRTSDLLTGGAFGPEASLPAVCVGLAVFIVIMLRLPQHQER